MRAVTVDEYGGPEVLRLVERDAPRPGPGQVAIDVAYAGVNFADILARRDGYQVPGLPFVPGLEVSGTVRSLGPGVEELWAGQSVAAFIPSGGYAEVALAPARAVYPLPERTGLREAATWLAVLPTAQALVHELGRLRSGESVLVHGAAGGVGTAAGQLARAAGASAVYGVVSSADKADYARTYGYDEVFVGDDFAGRVRETTGGRGVDLILDPVGGETLRAGLDLLPPFGRLVSYGNVGGAEPWRVGPGDLLPGSRAVLGFSIRGLAKSDPEALRRISQDAVRLAATGLVELPITGEYTLERAADAHRRVESRATTGKLVIRVAGE